VPRHPGPARRVGRPRAQHRQGGGLRRAAQRQRRPARRGPGQRRRRRLGPHPRRLRDVEDRRAGGRRDAQVPRAPGRPLPGGAGRAARERDRV
ncbi:MAG: [NiFe] hydrogenase metallocenter assembly protein HypC, partial [uncultured Thermoleophilia bacterium]